MKRKLPLALAATALLGGCGTFRIPDPSAWAGTGQQSINHYAVTAMLLKSGAKLQGTYTVTGIIPAKGTLDLTLDGDSVHGTVAGLGGCTYAVTGTAADTQLTLSLQPRSCLIDATGVSGTWDLKKCTTGNLVTLCENLTTATTKPSGTASSLSPRP